MIRVETQAVIQACNDTLQIIYKNRSNSRREYCNKWLARANKNWQKYWRWLGFHKPVLRDALFEFYHSSFHPIFPPSLDVHMSYGRQEEDCKDLLRAAKATNHRTMWISTSGANACGLRG